MSFKQCNTDNFIYKIILNDLKKKKITHVKTRFPPEPNGHLHIGHAKSICLNFNIAKQFKGTCNLRFDDTNPKKENTKFINSIVADIKWLGFNWHNNICYASSYFDQIYNFAIELIKKGLAYVDLLTKDDIRKFRGTLTTPGKNSPYRLQTIEENLTLFKKMKSGGFSEGQACLRAKIDMSSSCITMRDPVLYRIIFSSHHQTKYQWCIYPTYDFTHCISDSLEKITHSLCTLEFQDNRKLYEWILNNITINRCSYQYEFSRLKLEYTILSKRKLNTLIKKNIVPSWDDPRIPTISGLRRRGYTPNSIKEFCNKIGITKQEHTVQLSLLESCIRSELNLNAPRYMAVLNPIKIEILNFSNHCKETLYISNHPKKLSMGSHNSIFSKYLYIDREDFCEKKTSNTFNKKLQLGKEIRLRHAYIIKAKKIEKDQYNNITKIVCTYDKNTLGKNPINKKISGVIHWISNKNAIPAKFHLYEPLFVIKNPEIKKNFLDYINKNSLVNKIGFVESDILNNISSNHFQFEREGYFCIDKTYHCKKYLHFNRIIPLKKTNKI